MYSCVGAFADDVRFERDESLFGGRGGVVEVGEAVGAPGGRCGARPSPEGECEDEEQRDEGEGSGAAVGHGRRLRLLMLLVHDGDDDG